VLVERMKREFRVEANIGRPQVAYRETVRRKAEKVDARSLYILKPELVGAAMATDRDRLGLANKG